MLSFNNNDSKHHGESSNTRRGLQQQKEAAPKRPKVNKKSGNIKILSQTLLKAANLTSRKEFLDKALGDTNTKINSFIIRPPVRTPTNGKSDIIAEVQKGGSKGKDNISDDFEMSDSNSGQGKFIRNIMRRKQEDGKKETISDSDDKEEELNNQNTKEENHDKREQISDSDSSEEIERSIRKTQVSKLDITPNKSDLTIREKKKHVRLKAKEKKREVLSNSSDSEADQIDGGKKCVKNLQKDNRNEQSSSNDSSDRESDKNGVNRMQIFDNNTYIIKKNAKLKEKVSYKKDVNRELQKKCNINENKYTPKLSGKKQQMTLSKESENDSNKKHAKNMNRKESLYSDNSNKGVKTNKQNIASSSDSEPDNKQNLLNSKNKKLMAEKSDSSSTDSENDRNDTKSNRMKQNVCTKSSSSDSESASSSEDNKRKKSKCTNVKNRKAEVKSRKRNDSSSSSSSYDSDSESPPKKVEKPSKLKRKYSETKSSDESSNEDAPNKKLNCPRELTESEKLLESFSQDNNYKKLKSKRESPLNVLGKHDEIYLVQMSKNIDPLSLLNQKISFDGPTKLKMPDGSYIWDVNREKQEDVLLINFDNLLHIKSKGIITVQPHFKSKNTSLDMSRPIEDIVEVPSDLKVRHPLFGISYEEQMTLDDEIMNKLDEIFVDINKKNKRKSKKKQRNIEDGEHEKMKEEQQDDALDIIKLLNQHESRKIEDGEYEPKKGKKKQKRDREESKVSIYNQSVFSDTIIETNKAKKKKKNKSRDEADNLTQSIVNYPDSKQDDKAEQNLSHTSFIASIIEESSKSTKKDDTKSIEVNREDQIITSNTPKKQKHKKHKEKDNSNHDMNEEQPPAENVSIMEATTSNTSKKKKHKKNKPMPEEIEEGKSFMKILIDECKELIKPKEKRHDKHEEDVPVTNPINYEGKKKHKSELKIVNSTMMSSRIGDTMLQLEESAIPKAKKKKHKRRNSIETFIDDLVKDVTSSEEAVITHKKKNKKKHKYTEETVT